MSEWDRIFFFYDYMKSDKHGTAITAEREFWSIEDTCMAYMKELTLTGETPVAG